MCWGVVHREGELDLVGIERRDDSLCQGLLSGSLCACVCVSICVCVSVCVCV